MFLLYSTHRHYHIQNKNILLCVKMFDFGMDARDIRPDPFYCISAARPHTGYDCQISGRIPEVIHNRSEIQPEISRLYSTAETFNSYNKNVC